MQEIPQQPPQPPTYGTQSPPQYWQQALPSASEGEE